ncbi:Predicted NTPase (NACHT family) [Actinomadura madurae]|nr:Predicted NTPase (NACHT family) [Actinomadura madurae]
MWTLASAVRGIGVKMAIMGKGKGWWPWLAVLAAVAGVLALAGWTFEPLLFGKDKDWLEEAANRAQLTGGLLLGAAVALVTTVRWARQRSRRLGAAPAADTLAQAKQVLAELVDQQWKQEARLRSLDDPDPIPVRWRTPDAAELMDHAVNIDPSAGPPGGPAGGSARLWWAASSADIGALADRFRRTRRRRLVILGGPGTGKTTLALQLLLHLLATRTADEPVPILLPVAGWDTRRHPRLQDWIADRLTGDYPALRAPELGAEVARALAGRGHILPVLDGLDELPPPAHTAVITALNRSLGGDDQLILTSRTTEFTAAISAAGDVITSAAVLEPRPLTPAAAADHLTRCLPPSPGPAWQQTLTALRATPPAGQSPPGQGHRPAAALADLTATPLGLWLVRTVYTAPGADPAPLTDPDRFPTPAALQAHLLDQLIPALITTRIPSDNPAEPFRPRRRHDPAQVHHWLGYLAHHLTTQPATSGQGTRDLAWWRLAATTNTFTATTRLVITLTIALTTGLTTGLAAGITEGLFLGGLMAGLVYGLAGGATLGLAAGLAVGITARSWTHDPPGYADLHLRRRSATLARSLATRLPHGLAAGLAVGFVLNLTATVGEYYLAVNSHTSYYKFRGSGGFFAADGYVPTGYEEAGNLADFLTANPVKTLMDCLLIGLILGPPLAIGLGIMAWAATPARTHHATTPMSSWRTDRRLNLLRFFTATLAFVLTGTLVSGIAATFFESTDELVVGLVSGPLYGLLVGAPTGFAFGLMFGKHRAWWAYLIATWKLARAGHLPHRLMPFLDDCHRLGLLRTVGPYYQFRHAELHDHLAATHPPPHNTSRRHRRLT